MAWGLDHAIAGQVREATLDYDQQVHKSHGRLETRQVWGTEQVDWFADRDQRTGLRSLIAVDGQRPWADGRIEKERRYLLRSLKGVTARRFGQLIRRHGQVENSLHWSVDVSFNEDASRIRNGYAAENFSRLRRIALTLLKRGTTEKVGIKVNRLRAGWDDDYLLKVLTA